MSAPLQKTFDLLAGTANPNAVDVLLAALDLDLQEIRIQAVGALARRETLRGRIEIIRRLDSFGEEAYASLVERIGKMHGALRHCLLHGEIGLRRRALEIVQATDCYEQVDTLLELFGREEDELQAELSDVFSQLMRQIYKHCASGRGKSLGGRAAWEVKQKVLTQLASACSNYAELSAQEEVLTAILALGDPDHFAVKRVLSQSSPECRQLAGRLLSSSRHPGVINLVLEWMGKNYPHARIFEVIQQREDLEFVEQLLRWLPRRPTELQQKNFEQIESVAWLHPDHPVLLAIEPQLQARIVDLLATLGLTIAEKDAIQEWLVRHGSPEGRLAATDVLSSLDDSRVEHIILNGLNSGDENVQAWATSQLREHRMPETFSLLIERLDSDLPAVREAAREELSSFNLETLLGLIDHLDPAACRRAGSLIQKVDATAVESLSRELANPVRRKRIRAARACRMMGMQQSVVPALLAMLEDNDNLVRRTALEVLQGVSVPEVLQAVRSLTDDPSPRVRETASRTLATLVDPGHWSARSAGNADSPSIS